MSTMANEQADTAIEADEQLKKRARRRLVGAAALVLLAVIVLPLVMDHEPRPAAPEIQVRIPSPQDAPPFQPKLPAAKSTDAKEQARPIEVPPAPEPKPQPAPKADAKPDAVPTVPQKPEAKPAEAAVAAAKPADKPTEKTPDKAAEARRAEAALGGASGAATGNGQWVVQLGAYKEAGNVKLLLGKLKEMGLPAYTEKFDTPQGPRTRVRAGPFPSKEAAERAQQRIKTIGVSGPVAPK